MHAVRDTSGGSDGHAAARTCIVSRAVSDPVELIRFVVGPSEIVTPDVANKLPGRGAWVSGHREAIQEAALKGAFQRAFRRRVTVPDDLADLVDNLLLKRAVQGLSLANKAGLAVAGHAKVDAAISSGHATVLLHAADASGGGADRLSRKFRAVCQDLGRDHTIIEILTIEQLALAMGRSNVVHAALSSGKASDGFVTAAQRLMLYRQPQTDDSGQAARLPVRSDLAGRPAPVDDAGPETEEV